MARKPRNLSDLQRLTKSMAQIEMSAPWMSRFNRGNVATQSTTFLNSPTSLDSPDSEIMKLFIDTRTKAHEVFIRETEKTKRTGIWLAAMLLALACLMPVFAPDGRETISYWLSGALFIFAAGAMGYTSISLRDHKRELVASGPANKSN